MAKDSKPNNQQRNLKELENRGENRFEGARDLSPDDFEDFKTGEELNANNEKEELRAENEFERVRDLNPDDFEDFEVSEELQAARRRQNKDNKDLNKK
ncbi:hypothetical protein MWH25_05465 [Natroniella acetigena]|uniref:hypothetical protein n=1 Tax=Natroniella acetigena TaxID=52004 RepID=UPI002009FADF|nr:hypothetical protein [Natroniella acetigena]MCK8827187.1 hypothetical protein [Natroniella acetigena]